MTTHLPKAVGSMIRFLAEEAHSSTFVSNVTGEELEVLDHGEDSGHGEGHGSGFGVHIQYEDLYNSFIFLTCIYIAGKIAKLIRMPDLVGEIVAGILLGPNLAHFVPNPEGKIR